MLVGVNPGIKGKRVREMVVISVVVAAGAVGLVVVLEY
jgi:hypothetical protein